VLLCHHYQRADVYAHADITGDSLKLSRLASQADAEAHRLLRRAFHGRGRRHPVAPQQIAILPDLAAGCSMADMASLAKVERAWRELAAVLDKPDEKVTPVTYINSAADLKAFCGEHGGIVCTSTNAPKILDWSFAQREKVLFFPDQHLGRWTGFKMGIPLDEMVIWDPDLEYGGLTPEQIARRRSSCGTALFGAPDVPAGDIIKFRNQHPTASSSRTPSAASRSASSPTTSAAPNSSSTPSRPAPPNTRWLVGTELNLVERLAQEVKHEGKIVQFMARRSACARPCSASTRSIWRGRWRTWPRARW
jgi:quinolinate synthase